MRRRVCLGANDVVGNIVGVDVKEMLEFGAVSMLCMIPFVFPCSVFKCGSLYVYMFGASY